MKIKKSEFNERIDEAFEMGIRFGIENPEQASLYLANEKIKQAVKNASTTLAKAFNKMGLIKE